MTTLIHWTLSVWEHVPVTSIDIVSKKTESAGLVTSFAKQHDVFSWRHAGTDVMLTIIGSLMLVVNFSDSPSALLRLVKPL